MAEPVEQEPVEQDQTGVEEPPRAAPRRAVLFGACAAGVGSVLTACGGAGEDGGAGGAAVPTTQDTEEEDGAGGGSTRSPGKKRSAGAVLARTGDIPVGGGRIFERRQVVVTQPEAGTFRAFSTACTHMGCAVRTISGDTINCPCHGSKFSIADASVLSGPATRPLSRKKITVDGDDIRLA